MGADAIKAGGTAFGIGSNIVGGVQASRSARLSADLARQRGSLQGTIFEQDAEAQAQYLETISRTQAQIQEDIAIAQALTEERQAQLQADIFIREAVRERQIAAQEATEAAREGRQVLGFQRAIRGASGVQIGSGTAAAVEAETAKEIEFQRLNILGAGDATAGALEDAAMFERFRGETQGQLIRESGRAGAALTRFGGEAQAALDRSAGRSRAALARFGGEAQASLDRAAGRAALTRGISGAGSILLRGASQGVFGNLSGSRPSTRRAVPGLPFAGRR